MGDHIRSKTKLGYHISTKIISILLVLLLTATAFSSIITAQKSTDSIRDKIKKVIAKISGDGSDKTGDSGNGAAANAPASTTKFSDIFKELSILKRNRTSIFSVVTKYNGTEKTTRLKLFLPTAIDVNKDGKNDIRVWIFRLPGIDLNPPAACIKTTLLVRRLNDDIKKGPFEIYLQFTPKVLSNSALENIRVGYQTPAGEEVPKTCIVTHKDIPHLLYPRLKTTQRISINPISIVGKSQLNLIFSIVNETSGSELTIQVNNSPAIKNEISFSLSKDHFIRRGQTLEISRKNAAASNVSLTIRDVMGVDSGSITIKNLPKKIALSWLLAPAGYLELNTHGSSTGKVEASVDGAISLGFKPETGANFRLGWDVDRLTRIGALIGLSRGKSFDLTFDASASATLSDLYVDVPNFKLLNLIKPQKLKLTASLLSFNLKAGADAGKVVLKPYAGADTVAMNVENADVVLKDCNINLITIEPPIVSITYPKDGETVRDVVTITGTANAPPGKTIKSVTISIDGEDPILVSGTTTWSYVWDTTSLPNGNHTITAQVFDSESNSNKDTITVIVNNAEHKWKPSVKITAPSNLQIIKGIVRITGTANDVDGDALKVFLQIKNILGFKIFDKDVELSVDQSGVWSYEWNTSVLTAGLYTIYVQSYDGKYNSTTDSVSVWVKLKCNLDFTLSEASINVTNFVINSESLTLDVSSFVLSGSGSLKIANGAIDADVSGSLKLKDFSALKKNETNVTKLSVENLNTDLSGYGEMILSQSEIGLEINASVHLDFDALYIADIPLLGALDLGAFVLSGKGLISAGIKKLNVNNIVIGGYGDRDDVTIEATDLLINISGQQQKYFLMGVDKIDVTGNGNISLLDKSIEVNGSLDKFDVNNFYIQGDLAKLAFSGSIDHTRDVSFKIEFTNLLNFNISYDGENSLEIANPKVVLQSTQGTIIAFANSITISRQGYVGFSYYKDDLSATCWVNISEVCFTALSLSFDELSVYAGDICGTGTFCFSLSSIISIVYGNGWINITIGGKGMVHIIAHANIYTDEVYGSLDVDVLFNNGDDTFVINISGIPNNIAVYMDGSAALDLDAFDILLRDKTDASDLVNISLDSLDGNFIVHANEGIWQIDTTQGIDLEKLFFTIFLKSSQTFFSIDIDSIETSGGGRIFIDKENKIITYISGDDTDKTISLSGLDVIAGFLNVIIDELDLSLSGTDTTISFSSLDNVTKLDIDFAVGAYVALGTLWAYIPGLAEIRVHDLQITAPLIVTFTKGESMPITIQTSGTITFDELSILQGPIGMNPNFYGGKIKGSSILLSIGFAEGGGIKLDADAAAEIYFETVIIPKEEDVTQYNNFNFTLGGKGSLVVKDFGLPFPLIVEANVSEPSVLSLEPNGLRQSHPKIWNLLKNRTMLLTLEPGEIYLNIGLSDVLAISTSLVTLDFEDPISKFINASLSFKGYVEFHLGGDIEEQDDTYIMPVFSGQIAGWLKISRYKLIGNYIKERYVVLNGNGSGYIQTTVTDDDTLNLVAVWEGGPILFIRNIEICGIETAFMFGLHDLNIDVSLNLGPVGNGFILLGAILRNIVGNRLGIWYLDSDGEWQLISPLLKLIYLWLDIEPPIPEPKGLTTLIADSSDIGTTYKIPGDEVDFTAWYVPAGIIELPNSLPEDYPSEQGQSEEQEQENQNQYQVQVHLNNNGQGSPLDGGQNGQYTFTLNYGDGSSKSFPVSYSGTPEPIKVDLGNHLYTSLGTFTATLTVSGDPGTEEVAVDTLTIKVEENYFDVSTKNLTFDYANIGSDGKIHSSFEVSNLANEGYSNYILNWSIIQDNIKWGSDWTFEPSSGSLKPNRSQVVEVSFFPPEVKGDYGNASFTVINNNPSENVSIDLFLKYGLIELLPTNSEVLYMPSGGTATIDDAFWVYRTRWEKNDDGVAWEICENSFEPGMITFIPDSGTIPRGQGPTPVDLRVTASEGVYRGTIKVCRVGDPADNDTVDITIVVGMNGELDVELFYDGDKLFENQPFTIHVTDADSGGDVPFATVTYQKYDESEVYDTGETDDYGEVDFTSVDVSMYEDVKFCKASVEAIGYNSNELFFSVYDSTAQIHGFVYDLVTGEGIGNALVTAEPGSYSANTLPLGVSKGRYVLRVSAGTYTVTASKDGYASETVENVNVGPDGYFYLCFNLTPYNLPPVAEAGGRYSGYVDEPITFDGSGSYDPDGFIVQYDWKWETMGDWEENIGPNPTHIYTTPGYRTIFLKVHDDGGSTAEDTATVTVNKGFKIDAPNTVNENEEFTVTVTQRDGSTIFPGCFVDFNGETKYAPFGTTTFQAPAVYMNVDKRIHAWQELSDNEAFRYITVINTG